MNHDKEVKSGEHKPHAHKDKKDSSLEIDQAAANGAIKQNNAEKQPSETPVPENAEGAEKALADRLKALEAENAEMKDKYLRKYAEFENFKKRMQREREEFAKYSNSMLLLDITGVIDDFERAIKSAEESNDFKAFHSGIVLIEKQLVSILEKKWGLERFSAKGSHYDPERHEAIMSENNALVEKPTVVEDYQRGYLLHGRVLRPAKVKIAQPLSEGNSNAKTNNDNNGKNESEKE